MAMWPVGRIATLIAAMLLASCATRPVTQGVTGVDSVRIAQAIRCELRDSIVELIVLGVARTDKTLAMTFDRDRLSRVPAGETEDSVAEKEAVKFASFLKNGYKTLGDSEFAQTIETYTQTFVAYTFDFDIEQTHGLGGGFDILSTMTRGTLSIPIDAGFEGIRKGKREFTLNDQFGELLTNRPTIRICNLQRRERKGERLPNQAYPIAGKLNMGEILRTFITLNQSGNLVDSVFDQDIIPTQSDTVTFTTTLSAGTKPLLKLEPLGRSTTITGADLDIGWKRVDIHKLTLSMNLPSQDSVTVARQRSDKEQAVFDRQQRAALLDIERQRIRDIDDEDALLRRRLLGL